MKNIYLLILILIPICLSSQNNPDWANLQKYASENTKIKNVIDNKRVVFIGNSITEGWKEADPSFFTKNPYINRGIGGQTTPQMLIRFRPDVLDLKPKVVVILAGINDIAENTGPMTAQETFGNIVSMAQLAKAQNIKVIISSILPANVFPWRPNIKPADKVIEINAMLKKYCLDSGTKYLDYYTSMVDAAKGLKKEFTTDGVHCTLAGYKHMETLVQTTIAEELKK